MEPGARTPASAAPPAWTEAEENTTDLRLNQYWYSPATIAALTGSVQAHATSATPYRVGFLSTPSLFFALTDPAVLRAATLFEYDDRWAADAAEAGGAFAPFDYNAPPSALAPWAGSFELLVIDPPFIDRPVWAAYMRAAAALLSAGGELLLTTVAEREEELTAAVRGLPQAAGRAEGWGLRRHRFEPINEGCAHRFCVFSTWATTPLLDAVNPEPLPACIAGVDDEDDLLGGAIGRDAMLAISCESDDEPEQPEPQPRIPEPEPEPEPKPEPEVGGGKAERWWERNDRPFAERFVTPLRIPWSPHLAAENDEAIARDGEAQSPEEVRPEEWLTLEQSAGSGPDSDGQVTCWDAAILLHRLLLCAARLRSGAVAGQPLAGVRVVELGAGCGLVGITAARLGAAVCLTDLGAVLPTLRANVAANCAAEAMGCGSAAVLELFWGKLLPADVEAFLTEGGEQGELWVLASDVVYLVQILPELAATIRAICGAAAAKSVKVVLVNERRWADVDRWFLEALAEHFVFEELEVPTALSRLASAEAEAGDVADALAADGVLAHVARERFCTLSLQAKGQAGGAG